MAQQMNFIIHNEMENITNLVAKSISQSTESILQDKFAEKLNPQFEQILKTTFSKQITAEISKQIMNSLQKPMKQSFVNYFEQILIPGFDKSIKIAFQQINTSFQEGLQSRLQQISTTQSNGYSNQNVEKEITSTLKFAVDSLVQVSQVLSQSIVETQHKILSDYAERSNPQSQNENAQEIVNPLTKLASSLDNHRNQLLKLVQKHQYQEAFSTALEFKNIEIVTWLCSKVDSNIFLENYPVSQPVLLSLIQQLSFKISTETSLKLTWIKACLLALDLKDPVYLNKGPQILDKLWNILSDNAKNYKGAIANEFRTLILITSSLLK